MNAFDSGAWRQETRTRLLAARASLPLHSRRRKNDRITASLLACFEPLALRVIGSYVPLHGEFDPRRVLKAWHAWGVRIVLPGGLRGATPGQAGWRQRIEPAGPIVHDLPAPCPDALLVPATGFDEHGYRLGYGDGSFDHTLARFDPSPLRICATYELGRLETVHPRAHDVPMHFVVTEEGVYEVMPQGLRAITRPVDAAAAAARILARARRRAPAGATA